MTLIYLRAKLHIWAAKFWSKMRELFYLLGKFFLRISARLIDVCDILEPKVSYHIKRVENILKQHHL